MNGNFGNLALDGVDPRLSHDEKNPGIFAADRASSDPRITENGTAFTIQAALIHNDPSVLFEEYLHYAAITRDAESHYESGIMRTKGMWNPVGIIKNRFSKGHRHQAALDASGGAPQEEKSHHDYSTVTDDEWRQASRATRTASWSTIFFIITTDILGPGGAPWAFANTGYGPGVALYTVFGFFAALSGWYLWGVYMHTDSDRYPIRDFGQAFFRVYGSGMRHFVNVLQSLQMFMLVAVLVLGLGGSISEVSIGRDGVNGNGLCFIVCLLIIALLGMFLGQIRTLQRFGWLANFAVWTTVVSSLIAMIVSATESQPNYAVMLGSFGGPGTAFGDTNFPDGTVGSAIPLRKFAGTPDYGFQSGGVGFLGSFQGINTIIYSYGGAMLFFNLLAEMRNPWDFWKGMLCADIFIYLCYMFFGLFQYSYQGQYTYAAAIQSISQYGPQTAGNILSIIGGLIAAALYGNIGIKVIYNNVCVELLHFPVLTEKKGKIIWVVMVPLYWSLAFVVAGAVPNLGDFSSLVGAFCIGNFTYAFPALLKIGFDIKKGAMLPEEHFDRATGKYVRLDNGMKRWARGYAKTWLITSCNIIYLLGALVVCGLGMYSAISALQQAFGGGSSTTQFSCASPYAG